MIAHKSEPDSANERSGDDSDTPGRPSHPRLTNLELRVGTLRLPLMGEIRNLAVKLRFPAATRPYVLAFRLLTVLLVVLLVVGLIAHLTVP